MLRAYKVKFMINDIQYNFKARYNNLFEFLKKYLNIFNILNKIFIILKLLGLTEINSKTK